jgi:hypothetical protein
MANVSEDLAPSTMPEEAPQLGDGSSFKAQRSAYAQAGSPSQGGAPPPTQGASPVGAAQQPQSPVQPPPPRTPFTEEDMRPGGPVFMQSRLQPIPSWRQQLRTWADHPEANIIRRLSQRADAGMKNQQGGQ